MINHYFGGYDQPMGTSDPDPEPRESGINLINLFNPTGAVFSPDGRYRYALWRVWNQIRQPLLFIGLNPSTADHTMNDPTVTRCITRAAREGFGGLLVGNLFALVSSDPDVILKDSEAIGIATDDYLQKMIGMAGKVLCAWGSFPAAKKRSETVLGMIPEPYCLGINRDGQPKHPLYISYGIPMLKLGPGVQKKGASGLGVKRARKSAVQ